jgi:hypothetical protein
VGIYKTILLGFYLYKECNMSYFEDLSIYTYYNLNGINKKILNVGWLDHSFEYDKGNVSDEFLDKLVDFIKVNLFVMRGFHVCNLCLKPLNNVLEVKHNNKVMGLGFAEIRVFGEDEKIYAAPNLIYHYITSHNYLPPTEFIKAVINKPQPDTKNIKNYWNFIDLNNVKS